MLRLFMFCCVLIDVTSTLASLGSDIGRFGVAWWIALNVLLLLVPLAIRAAEPLLSALAKGERGDDPWQWSDAATANAASVGEAATQSSI